MPDLNVSNRLHTIASQIPDNIAIAEPLRGITGTRTANDYRTITFRELDDDVNRIARGLVNFGIEREMRIVLMVRQGIDFVALFYSLLKVGAVVVLIDPGMGLRQLLNCLSQVNPDGFVAIPMVHAVRCFCSHKFPNSIHNVTAGRRLFWGGTTLTALRQTESCEQFSASTKPDDNAAIIFTSGSTGEPKGVLYSHRIFDTQVHEVATRYGIDMGGIDLAAFPFFGLFNAAMGTTAVIPEMNPTKPAKLNPKKFMDAADAWQVTQSFGSPALWNRVAKYCEQSGRKFKTLRRCVSAGAPIAPSLLARMKKIIAPDGDIFTPYGATESLPVASISASEVLKETAEKTKTGKGICVGNRFGGIEWNVIKVTEKAIPTLDEAEILTTNQVGELIVTGNQVTKRYVTGASDANEKSKIKEGERTWHRIGDVGYIDEQDRFWICGRKSHRVETEQETMFTVPCEAIFNQHKSVYRSALAGAVISGKKNEEGVPYREPCIFIEPKPEEYPKTKHAEKTLIEELRTLAKSSPLTEQIKNIFILKHFPVDVRHNAKINREKLSDTATKKCKHNQVG
ncbi:MAG: AMP-binding protein [Planctomycetaceae bacterium]|jgi:acyl-CoA synthetase (AMP-forming)/AMP-acid ligase II|nr:AMP-binding protein [Planctomycetaceae bacterium]